MRNKDPEKEGGKADETMGPLAVNFGLFGHGFPNIGPEKACLLAFLALDARFGSS